MRAEPFDYCTGFDLSANLREPGPVFILRKPAPSIQTKAQAVSFYQQMNEKALRARILVIHSDRGSPYLKEKASRQG